LIAAEAIVNRAAGGGRKGTSLPKLKIAVWQPGLEPAVITEALNSLERTLFYLRALPFQPSTQFG